MLNKKTSGRVNGTILVSVLWILQSVGRIFFAFLGTPAGMGQFIDTPIAYAVSLTLFSMFLFLGVLGFIAVFGLITKQKWGLWGTIMVSVATIVFDLWGLTIQLTAVIGLIVPAISILYLYSKRSEFMRS